MGFLAPLLTPILTGVMSKTVRIAIIVGFLAIGIFMFHSYSYNQGFRRCLKDFPQNVYNGPTTVNQGKKMACFPLHIGHFGLGVCHD